MRSYPEIGIWELISGTPCFGPHLILCGQNPLTTWYLGPDINSLAIKSSQCLLTLTLIDYITLTLIPITYIIEYKKTYQ
jgi:hypothetical protein